MNELLISMHSSSLFHQLLCVFSISGQSVQKKKTSRPIQFFLDTVLTKTLFYIKVLTIDITWIYHWNRSVVLYVWPTVTER